ncbi:nuclear transport factor 2 family protein [Sediminitomix flava]|uniref:Putative SnoaL-like aldol condensation-catalyzing enzyme n=1 Tax=Sediminitomix flava TaxID=379075 RepID=A0A315Z6M3_SEDFL|nr:nuclear transport factor 2 family protein [Sediminitomix flava]PWJ39181.1 putative SnoaL-like aldol condensation-catalyzing enzyme [Sediminitomix flava]
MKTIQLILLSAIALFSACTNTENKTSTSEPKAKMTTPKKEQVTALLKSIETGDSAPVTFINPNKYIQHNLAVADGLAGFGAVLQQLPEGSAKVDIQRVFEDGDYVVTHTKYNFFGPKAGFDIFRFEDGKIVEHWDNLQDIVDETASGRTQFDGPTEIQDLDKTKANKQLIEGFVKDILMGGNPDKITEYISTTQYHQHNPHVKDGLKGLGEALSAMAEARTPMTYEKNHFILGEGNFVLSASEGIFMKKYVAFYDLFRIEGGKIVEHWDTIEEIPAKSNWKNQNGKF